MSTLDYATPEPITQIEHRVESIGGFFRSFDIEQRLERLLDHRASEGWELIETHRTFFSRYTLIFRRRRST